MPHNTATTPTALRAFLDTLDREAMIDMLYFLEPFYRKSKGGPMDGQYIEYDDYEDDELVDFLEDLVGKDPGGFLDQFPIWELILYRLMLHDRQSGGIHLNDAILLPLGMDMGIVEEHALGSDMYSYTLQPDFRRFVEPYFEAAYQRRSSFSGCEKEAFLWGALAICGMLTREEVIRMYAGYDDHDKQAVADFCVFLDSYAPVYFLEYVKGVLIFPSGFDYGRLHEVRTALGTRDLIPRRLPLKDVHDTGMRLPWPIPMSGGKAGRTLRSYLNADGFTEGDIDPLISVLFQVRVFDVLEGGDRLKAYIKAISNSFPLSERKHLRAMLADVVEGMPRWEYKGGIRTDEEAASDMAAATIPPYVPRELREGGEWNGIEEVGRPVRGDKKDKKDKKDRKDKKAKGKKAAAPDPVQAPSGVPAGIAGASGTGSASRIGDFDIAGMLQLQYLSSLLSKSGGKDDPKDPEGK